MDLKYLLYETAVQNPAWQMKYLSLFHRGLTGRTALSMREDFCGSGKISCEWVKKSPKHTAVGLDLDPEPLEYAERVNRTALSSGAQNRVRFLKQDVLQSTREKFDLIGAHNFSFFTFHDRPTLLRYARSVHQSLKKQSTFFMEMAGGPVFQDPSSEKTTVQVPGVGKVQYLWEHHEYDPILGMNDYSIHFKLPRQAWWNDVFRYHWRLWGIREVREILAEAGFSRSVVLWPVDGSRGEAGVYSEREITENYDVWVCYVVGIKD